MAVKDKEKAKKKPEPKKKTKPVAQKSKAKPSKKEKAHEKALKKAQKLKEKKEKHGAMYVPSVLAGVIIVIIGLVVTLLVRGFYPIWIGEIAGIGIGIIGWLIAFIGAAKMKGISKDFKYIYFATLAGGIAKVAEAGIGLRNHFTGYQLMAFVEFYVIGFAYISILALMFVYYMLTQGLAKFAPQNAQPLLEKRSKEKAISFVIIFGITLLVVPMAGVASIYIESGIIAIMLIVFFMKLGDIHGYAQREYKYIIGKKPNFLRGRDFAKARKKAKVPRGKAPVKPRVNDPAKNGEKIEKVEKNTEKKETRPQRPSTKPTAKEKSKSKAKKT